MLLLRRERNLAVFRVQKLPLSATKALTFDRLRDNHNEQTCTRGSTLSRNSEQYVERSGKRKRIYLDNNDNNNNINILIIIVFLYRRFSFSTEQYLLVARQSERSRLDVRVSRRSEIGAVPGFTSSNFQRWVRESERFPVLFFSLFLFGCMIVKTRRLP